MKAKLNLSLLLAITAFLAFGCNHTSDSTGRASTTYNSLDQMKHSGKIKACYIKYPPFVIQDPQTGKLSGYFIDLMGAIAQEAGVSVDYEETNWGTMVAALQSNKCDVVVSGVFGTIPRAKEVTFSEPVLYVGISAIARRNDSRFKTVDDLAQPNLVVAVTSGEVGHEYAKKFLPNAKLTVIETDDISRPMLEVSSGRADVALGDSMTAYRFAKAHQEVKDVFAKNPFYVFGTGLMLRRNDYDWLDFLNIGIEHLELSGITDKLEAKYKEGSSAWISKRKPWQ